MPTTIEQPDLFGDQPSPTTPDRAVVAGLSLQRDFICADDEAALIERIDAEHLTPFKFQQWEGKRLTTSFGWNYDFTVGGIAVAPPIPEWLLSVRKRAADFAASCLTTSFRPC